MRLSNHIDPFGAVPIGRRVAGVGEQAVVAGNLIAPTPIRQLHFPIRPFIGALARWGQEVSRIGLSPIVHSGV